MRKKLWVLMLILVLGVLAACSEDSDESDELAILEVEFELPETADVDETIELVATVTYGDELVEDADEVNFEYWLGDDQDNSTTIDSTNNEDGTYTAEVAFEQDGVYSIYAHTTARDMHTMPKREVTVGDGVSPEAEHDHDGDHGDADGFGMHFMEPENVTVDEDVELMVHLQMDDDPFEEAEVRYEIWSDDVSDKHDWVDAEESVAGEYVGTHVFTEASTYTIQIHVEDDDGLHEHQEYEVEVAE